ncbi:MAG: peptide/nickel transport system permease protein [Myxococcota bacterium]
MIAYIFRRILAMIPTLLGITLVTFAIISLAPGDPVATSFGAGGGEQSTEAGGGGNQDQDRMADAIRAKKKLLGILEEDRQVLSWSVDGFNTGGDLLPMYPVERLGDLPGWSRTLTVDGSTIYVGGADGTITVMSDSGSVTAQWDAHENPLTAIAVVGDRIVSADGEGIIERWSMTGESAGQTQPLNVLIREILPLPDGERFLSAADDGIIRLHRADNGTVERRFEGHNNRVYTIALSGDGKSFWSGGYDRSLRQWDLASGKELANLEGHGQAINDIAVFVDDSKLVTACDDRYIRIFDLTGSDEPVVMEGHYKKATAVALSADGSRIFSGSRDETIRVWDTATGIQLAQSDESTGRIRDLDVSADGRLLSSADSWATVPVHRRYFSWLWRIIQLDFDRSFVDDQPVMDKIKKALPVTIGLNVIALLVVYTFSIPLGVFAAVKRNSTFDHVSSLALFTLYSIPSFWLATLLIMMFSSRQALDILPSVGLHGDAPWDMSYLEWLWDFLKHMLMPVLVMSYGGLASLSRYARTSMLETIGEDYIRTARAKGLEESVVIWKHAFRNSLITIVTLLGNLLPALIGGSVIVEYIFSINGMGRLGFDAILARDYPVIMAITTFSALLTLVGILISDILYSIVDPRVTQK